MEKIASLIQQFGLKLYYCQKIISVRKVILYIATSLDGKIARPDGALDWLPDPAADDYGYQAFYDSVDTILLGFKTYEICLSFGDWPYPGKTTFVFSRDASKTTLSEAQLVTDDPVNFVGQLKQQPGKDLWLVGGGEIVALFHEAGLIDSYILAFIPIVLGEGIELFPNIRRQAALKLTNHVVYPNGLVLMYLDK